MKKLFALLVVCTALVAVGCGEGDTTRTAPPADGTAAPADGTAAPADDTAADETGDATTNP